jgi:hypothetical protein
MKKGPVSGALLMVCALSGTPPNYFAAASLTTSSFLEQPSFSRRLSWLRSSSK